MKKINVTMHTEQIQGFPGKVSKLEQVIIIINPCKKGGKKWKKIYWSLAYSLESSVPVLKTMQSLNFAFTFLQ